MRHVVILIHVEVDLEGFTVSAHDNVVGPVWVHLDVGVEKDRDHEAVLVLVVAVESALLNVLHYHLFGLARLFVEQLDRSQGHVVHTEHVSLGPWVEAVTSVLNSVLQRLEEDLDDSDSALSEVRVLSAGFQKVILVLGNEPSVEFALLEFIDSQGSSEELDVGWQADHVVVF